MARPDPPWSPRASSSSASKNDRFQPKQDSHARATFLHPADQAQRSGQPGLLLPVAAWRRGGAAALRASLVAARTVTEEAVYEVVLRQAALVEDLQGRRAAWKAEAGRRRWWCEEQLEQEDDAELGRGLLRDAYDHCGEVCVEYAKTFYLGEPPHVLTPLCNSDDDNTVLVVRPSVSAHSVQVAQEFNE
ncbi:hypothetical protein ZWY2020_024491 [Hordeum vulgare]|nr:hypothetical protein ZWY2020_024491 [Hordeum vulgare]